MDKNNILNRHLFWYFQLLKQRLFLMYSKKCRKCMNIVFAYDLFTKKLNISTTFDFFFSQITFQPYTVCVLFKFCLNPQWTSSASCLNHAYALQRSFISLDTLQDLFEYLYTLFELYVPVIFLITPCPPSSHSGGHCPKTWPKFKENKFLIFSLVQ